MYNSFNIPDNIKGWLGKKDPAYKANAGSAGEKENPNYTGLPSAIDKENAVTSKSAHLWKNRETNGGKIGSGWQFMPINLGGVQLWEPIIRAVGRKTIVETPLVERSGSVKEIISSEDWIFTIRGIIKRPDGSYPDTEIAQLVDLRAQNKSLPIISGITSMLLVDKGNEQVVITNVNFPDTQGYTGTVAYEIECISDIPFELEISNITSKVIVNGNS